MSPNGGSDNFSEVVVFYVRKIETCKYLMNFEIFKTYLNSVLILIMKNIGMCKHDPAANTNLCNVGYCSSIQQMGGFFFLWLMLILRFQDIRI